MRIGIIIANNTLGGSQRVAIILAKWLSNHNNPTSIISLIPTNKKGYDMSGIDFYQVPNRGIVVHLRKLVKRLAFDCVISMGVPISVYTVPACFGLHVKHIISERNDPSHFAGKKITKILSRLMMKHGDGFVFQTKDAMEFYKYRESNKNVAIIKNPLLIDVEKYNSSSNKLPEKTIVSVGRLVGQKNHRVLIEAFSKVCQEYNEYRLVIWGDGPMRIELKNQIHSLNLDEKVFLPGNTYDVFHEIENSSVFVLSSDFEGMPNSLIEAMAMGLPCISTDCPCGGPRELIKDGENGLLVPVGDAEGIAAAIKRILSNDSFASRLRANAKQIAIKLNPDVICREWYSFIEQVDRNNLV